MPSRFLPEPALFTLEGVAQGLEGPFVGAGDDPAVAAVVEQHVHRFLEHAFFVSNDDLRGLEFDEPLEPVVPVDDPPVQIIEVGCGEPPAFQGNQGPQVRGQDRNHVHDHPQGILAAAAEGVHDFEAFGQFLALGHGPGGPDITLAGSV